MILDNHHSLSIKFFIIFLPHVIQSNISFQSLSFQECPLGHLLVLSVCFNRQGFAGSIKVPVINQTEIRADGDGYFRSPDP